MHSTLLCMDAIQLCTKLLIFIFIVPPPIEIKIINDIIQLREPIIHPRGIILHYEIVALQNSSKPIISNISTSTLDVPTSMLLTEPGTYSVKVSDYSSY